MMVDPRQQHRVAGDVVALLVVGEATTHHHVVRLFEIDLRVALHQSAQRNRGEVVGANVPERPLDRPSDGRPDCIDNDRFRHGSSSVTVGHDPQPQKTQSSVSASPVHPSSAGLRMCPADNYASLTDDSSLTDD